LHFAILVKEKIVISDLDGTIIDDNLAIKEASRKIVGKELNRQEVRKLPKDLKAKIYDLAQSSVDLFKPKNKVVELIKKLKEQGFYVVVLTARFEEKRKETEELLKKLGVPYDEVVLRDKEAQKKDDEVWKKEIIKELIAKEMVFLEDKPENLSLMIEAVKNLKKGNNIKDEYYLVVEKDLFKKID